MRKWERLIWLAALVAAISFGVVQGTSHEPSTNVRIAARVNPDNGRVEFGLQQGRYLPFETDPVWGDTILPAARFFPQEAERGRWLFSTPLDLAVSWRWNAFSCGPYSAATHDNRVDEFTGCFDGGMGMAFADLDQIEWSETIDSDGISAWFRTCVPREPTLRVLDPSVEAPRGRFDSRWQNNSYVEIGHWSEGQWDGAGFVRVLADPDNFGWFLVRSAAGESGYEVGLEFWCNPNNP